MAQWIGAQGRPKVPQISKTCPHCDVTYRNPPTKKTKNVFFISSRRLVESVDGLDSSLAQSAGELWSCKNLKSRVEKVTRAGLKEFMVENVFSHVCISIHIFIAKSFSLGNLSLLTNFQRLSTV